MESIVLPRRHLRTHQKAEGRRQLRRAWRLCGGRLNYVCSRTCVHAARIASWSFVGLVRRWSVYSGTTNNYMLARHSTHPSESTVHYARPLSLGTRICTRPEACKLECRTGMMQDIGREASSPSIPRPLLFALGSIALPSPAAPLHHQNGDS